MRAYTLVSFVAFFSSKTITKTNYNYNLKEWWLNYPLKLKRQWSHTPILCSPSQSSAFETVLLLKRRKASKISHHKVNKWHTSQRTHTHYKSAFERKLWSNYLKRFFSLFRSNIHNDRKPAARWIFIFFLDSSCAHSRSNIIWLWYYVYLNI